MTAAIVTINFMNKGERGGEIDGNKMQGRS